MPSRKGSRPACMRAKGEDSMKLKENDQRTRPKEQDHLSLRDVDSFILSMNRYVEELLNKVKVLPRVDPKGNSECPFAEDLYAEKEEAAEKVEMDSRKLRSYLRLVEEEIARCTANSERISADARSLYLDEAKERYAVAGQTQDYQTTRAIQQRKALTDLISKIEKALALARSNVFPGRKPKKSFQPPVGALGSWGATGSADRTAPKSFSERPSFETEINSLISLGPLGRKDI